MHQPLASFPPGPTNTEETPVSEGSLVRRWGRESATDKREERSSVMVIEKSAPARRPIMTSEAPLFWPDLKHVPTEQSAEWPELSRLDMT